MKSCRCMVELLVFVASGFCDLSVVRIYSNIGLLLDFLIVKVITLRSRSELVSKNTCWYQILQEVRTPL